jgi:hypothetical protein
VNFYSVCLRLGHIIVDAVVVVVVAAAVVVAETVNLTAVCKESKNYDLGPVL